MKKDFLIIILILFFIQLNSEEIKNYYNSYFGVYGKKASVMGSVDGKNLEVWIYPLNQSVPDQIWSSANTISAFVEGLLGLDVNALKKEIKLKSSFPIYWHHFELKNIKIGRGYFDLIYNLNEKNKVNVKVIAKGLNGFKIFYYKNKTINSKPVEININKNDFAKEISFVLKDYLYVFVEKNRLRPGDSSINTIVSDYYINNNNLYVELWSKLKQRVFIISDKRIQNNSHIKQIDKDLYVFYTQNSKNYKFNKFKFELKKEEK